jgi:hypothetical protein
LFLVLALAAALRLWGVHFGMPYEGITYNVITIEESQEVMRALKLGAGEYSWSFGKGGLYLILFVEYAALYVVSLLAGWAHNAHDFAVQIAQDRTVVYVLGRITNALLGVATCWVVYAAGRRLYDWRTGLLAALLGATAYFHVVFSGVINVDIGMGLALWASILAYIAYEQKGDRRLLVLAGALGAVSIAFKLPGIVIIPLLFVAIATAPRGGPRLKRVVTECATVFLSLIVALTVIAPEWVIRIDNIWEDFSHVLHAGHAGAQESDEQLADEITSITTGKGTGSLAAGYVRHLLAPYNLVLTLAAAAGLVLGVWRRNRWDLIFGGFVVVFVVVMGTSDRSQPERYLIPIVPALWLLASRALIALWQRHRVVGYAGLVATLVVPAYAIARQAVEKTYPDTRIVAKEWIEKNVPNGSRILIDGMRYRLSHSPPLNPDETTVASQVERASVEGAHLGRGVSKKTLSVYEEALRGVSGPRYELHSTVHGLQVQPLEYYLDECYGYVVTSSEIAGKFGPRGGARGRFPNSARFYDSLDTDPRSTKVYELDPEPWHSSGPTIKVYRLSNRCDAGATAQH